jgi:hypothetical protein
MQRSFSGFFLPPATNQGSSAANDGVVTGPLVRPPGLRQSLSDKSLGRRGPGSLAVCRFGRCKRPRLAAMSCHLDGPASDPSGNVTLCHIGPMN